MISWICIVLAHPKQQSVGRHVASLRQIIPIQRQPVFALTPSCWMLCGEAAAMHL
jgi:hypothetical protein